MGQFVDEYRIVRYPPVGDLAFQKSQHFVLIELHALGAHDNEERTLGPLRMGDANHRGLGNGRMTHRGILELDRADPLTTGLDHVLGPIRYRHVPVWIDNGDVTRIEPAVRGVSTGTAIELEIVAAYPRTADLQRAISDTVPGQILPLLVDDAQLAAKNPPPGLGREIQALVGRQRLKPCFQRFLSRIRLSKKRVSVSS